MSEYMLTSGIIKLSNSKRWEEARAEWGLLDVYIDDEPDTCLCGHFPIIEMCILKNKYNAAVATVGNCCVKKFLGLPSDKIFQAVKRVRKDVTKSLNIEAISHAYKKGWISEWENNFYLNIRLRRNLSEKQREKKLEVNRRIMVAMRKNG